VGAISYSPQKYLYSLGSWHLPFEYTNKVAQKAGLDHHFITRIQGLLVVDDAILVHASINLPDQFITNGGRNSAEADNIRYPAGIVDVVQHLEAIKAGKYISREQLRVATAIIAF